MRAALLRGGFRHRDRGRHVAVRLTGRLGGHRLAAGRYRLVAVPSRRGERDGRARAISFRIVG